MAHRRRQEAELEVVEMDMLSVCWGVTRIRNEGFRGTGQPWCLGDKARNIKPKAETRPDGGGLVLSIRGTVWFTPLRLGGGMLRVELAGRGPRGRAERRFMDVKLVGVREDGR